MGAGKTILLIEDDPIAAQTMTRLLAPTENQQTPGILWEVVHCAQFSSGVKQLIAGGIDLVLLDLNLPDIPGLQVVRYLQEHHADVPVIVLIDLYDETLAIQAIQAGSQDYLVKDSVDRDLLHRALCYAIERKRANKKLQTVHQQTIQILAAIPSLLISVDSHTTVIWWNITAEKIFGLTSMEAIGQPLGILQLPWDEHLLLEGLARCRSTNQVVSLDAVKIGCRNGSERVLGITFIPMPDVDGDSQLFLLFGADITERQYAEEALRKSEERYRALVEGSLQGISIISFKGKRLFANQMLLRILGYATLDDYLCHDAMENVAPHERQRLRHYREALMRGEPSQIHYEFEALHTDGSPIWLERIATPITWDEEPALLSSIIDITARKEAETEQERLQQQLIDSSRQAGMAELATGVLHNVGNVLNSVNVSARLLSDQLKQSAITHLAKASALLQDHASDLGAFLSTHAQGKHFPRFFRQLTHKLEAERVAGLEEVEALMRNVEHIKEIVSLQQSYARVSGIRERLDLLTLFEDALKTLDVSVLQANFAVVREVAAVPPVLTDKHKVLQILVNLISNAKHALLMAHPMQPRLTLRIGQPTPACVAVEVSDNGVGIEREHLTRIFEHGFTTKPDGHGFGLHSSALAAKELGGTLTASSEGPGCGATFRLELPLQTEGKNTCVKAIIVDNDVS
jgi:PAS domain S-box-containing protein